MSGPAVARLLGSDIASPWMRESLLQGGAISERALDIIATVPGKYYILVPSDLRDLPDSLGTGGVFTTSSPRQMMAEICDSLGSTDAYMYVEDDSWWVGDPVIQSLTSHYLTVGDHVIHWRELATITGGEAVRILYRSAFGYPLNAFIAHAGPSVESPCALEADLLERIVSTMMAVIVSVFDNESILFWKEERCTLKVTCP